MPVSLPAAGPVSRGRETFLRRLAGLLSRYLPTDTWPQARANLGNYSNSYFDAGVNIFIPMLFPQLVKMSIAP